MRKSIVINNRSFALILAVFILLAFSVFGISAIYLSSRKVDIYINQINNLKVFYLSEAARNFFLEDIIFDNDFTDNTDVTYILGEANTTFTIDYDETTLLARSADVTFSGNVDTATAGIVYKDTKNMDIHECVGSECASDNPLVTHLQNWNGFFGGGGSSITLSYLNTAQSWSKIQAPVYFRDNVAIDHTCVGANSTSGHICYSPNYLTIYNDVHTAGNLAVNGSSTYCPWRTYVFGDAYAGGTITESSNGLCPCCTDPTPCSTKCQDCPAICPAIAGTNYPNGSGSPPPPPSKPNIDSTYYDKLIAIAQTQGFTGPLNISCSSPSEYRLLKGKNIYVNGNVNITTSSSCPLQGVGNIIASGNITVNPGSRIGDKIGLIADSKLEVLSSWPQATYIGGTPDANKRIVGKGALIYVGANPQQMWNLNLESDTYVKATALIDNHGMTCLYQDGSSCRANYQGLVYTFWIDNYNGDVYGYLYASAFCGPGRTIVRIYDRVNYAFGNKSTESERPLEVRGLYRTIKIEN